MWNQVIVFLTGPSWKEGMETGWQLGRYFFLGHFYTSQFYELCSLFLSPSLPHSSLSYIQPQHSEFTLTLLLLTHRDCSVLNLRLVIFSPHRVWKLLVECLRVHHEQPSKLLLSIWDGGCSKEAGRVYFCPPNPNSPTPTTHPLFMAPDHSIWLDNFPWNVSLD